MLRYVGVSVLLDRALAATVAAKGLYFRANNNDDLLVDSCNVRQRFIVRDFCCFMGATCRHMSGCRKLALRPQIKVAGFPVGLDAAEKLYYQA